MKKFLNKLPEGNALSGIILTLCTIASLLVSNSFFGSTYIEFWHIKLGHYSLLHIVNDMLMTVFFLVVGLEIKKELLIGELKNRKKALLPALCAVGGMIIPALIFLYFNYGTINSNGWGIPTATDIAFSLGILGLLGSRIPNGLKVFLTALAIIDDLGAVLVIALFYSQSISIIYLLIALTLTALLLALQKKHYNIYIWLIVGTFIWLFLDSSGIHGTIAGVLFALTIPIEFKKSKPLKNFVDALHKPVNYIIIPLFAIANTAIVFNGDATTAIQSNISIGIILGLFLGKPLGILLTALFFNKFKVAELPTGVNWKMLIGVAFLAGIGFTMSLFVTFIAYEDTPRQDICKIAILIGSGLSGVIGLLYLKLVTKKNITLQGYSSDYNN